MSVEQVHLLPQGLQQKDGERMSTRFTELAAEPARAPCWSLVVLRWTQRSDRC